MITLVNRYTIPDPEARIREYIRVEIYRGYDDQHAIDNTITAADTKAANRLYARMSSSAAEALQNSVPLREALAMVNNCPLGEISSAGWQIQRAAVEVLLARACEIKGVALAVATKVLYLKRPRLFPIMDAFLVRLVLEINISALPKKTHPAVGVKAMDIIRQDRVSQASAFQRLAENLNDLPIPLEIVRLYDILAWSTEKWDILGNTHAPYGKALASPAPKSSIKKDHKNKGQILTLEQFDRFTSRGTGFIVITDTANPNRIHRADCTRLRRQWFETKVVQNRCKYGAYYFMETPDEAGPWDTRPCRQCMR